jgi:hypothetical protein
MRLREFGLLVLSAYGCAAGASLGQPPARVAAGSDVASSEPDDTALEQILYPPPIAVPEERVSRFGPIVTDETGRLVTLAGAGFPNSDHQRYGWVIWVGGSERPVEWVETVQAPRDGAWSPGDAKRVVEIDAHGHPVKRRISISPDGRTRTTHGESVPVEGFLHSESSVRPGTPAGNFAISVALPGGRTEDFALALGAPQGICPYSQISLQWWQDADDPELEALSTRVLLLFGGRLVYHGFVPTDDVREAHWVVDAIAMQSALGIETSGHVSMRAVADLLGDVMRYDMTTPGSTRDYGVLFSIPSHQLEAHVRELADEFAAKLSPYARELCADWFGGRFEEEARLERIRRGLVEEIERIRSQRREKRSHKRLELEVEDQAPR